MKYILTYVVHFFQWQDYYFQIQILPLISYFFLYFTFRIFFFFSNFWLCSGMWGHGLEWNVCGILHNSTAKHPQMKLPFRKRGYFDIIQHKQFYTTLGIYWYIRTGKYACRFRHAFRNALYRYIGVENILNIIMLHNFWYVGSSRRCFIGSVSRITLLGNLAHMVLLGMSVKQNNLAYFPVLINPQLPRIF